jgi:hypothetical protein
VIAWRPLAILNSVAVPLFRRAARSAIWPAQPA